MCDLITQVESIFYWVIFLVTFKRSKLTNFVVGRMQKRKMQQIPLEI